MFQVGALEVEFMGGLMTFDAVTGCGLLCGLVFLTGFMYAIRHEKRVHGAAPQER